MKIIRSLGLMIVAVLLCITAGKAAGAEEVNLIFCGPGYFSGEADAVKGKKYQGKAEKIEGCSAQEVFNKIEEVARSGKKVKNLEFIGHGLPKGMFMTGEERMANGESDRVTVPKLKEWAEKVKKSGKQVKDFFAPGADVVIRACYVGSGEMPTEFINILPDDATVRSDCGFYKTASAEGLTRLMGGTGWTRQRVPSKKEDFFYKKGYSGEKIAWADRRGTAPGDFTGTWIGSAQVTNADITDGTGKKFTQEIKPGNFTVTKDGKKYVLKFQAYTLTGEVNLEGHAILAGDGNIYLAELWFEGKTMLGKVYGRAARGVIIRDLVLTRN